MSADDGWKPVQRHNDQERSSETRPPFRTGKKVTAVKVETVASESQHLYIYGVPKRNLRSELKCLCMRYGLVQKLRLVRDCETEFFTECYHVQYDRIQSARVAKRRLHNRTFYGNLLQVCYAPEYETLQETRAKVKQRSLDVARRVYGDYPEYYIENKGGESSGAKRNFTGGFDDPVQAKRLCTGDIGTSSHALMVTNSSTPDSGSFQEAPKTISYGRFSPDDLVLEDVSEESEEDETVLLSPPVVKSKMMVCARRIVLKKKSYGLDDYFGCN